MCCKLITKKNILIFFWFGYKQHISIFRNETEDEEKKECRFVWFASFSFFFKYVQNMFHLNINTIFVSLTLVFASCAMLTEPSYCIWSVWAVALFTCMLPISCHGLCDKRNFETTLHFRFIYNLIQCRSADCVNAVYRATNCA